MLSIFSPQESLLRVAGHCVHSALSVFRVDCSLNNIKHLTTPKNNNSIELTLEQCIETVHVLLIETECIQFL